MIRFWPKIVTLIFAPKWRKMNVSKIEEILNLVGTLGKFWPFFAKNDQN